MADPLRCAEAGDLAPEVALGIASAEDRARLLWHVSTCVACRDLLSDMSALTDDILALTAEREPPAGFETHVLARMGHSTPRRRRILPSTWRRVALFAAAVVIAAAASAGAVYRAHTTDRDLAANVRATLATANGQYFAAAPLHDPGGERLGVAFGYQGDPAWVFVTATVPARSGPYDIDIVTHSGERRLLAEHVDLAATGAWGGTVPIAIHEIAVVRVLDADGRPVLSGQFQLP